MTPSFLPWYVLNDVYDIFEEFAVLYLQKLELQGLVSSALLNKRIIYKSDITSMKQCTGYALNPQMFAKIYNSDMTPTKKSTSYALNSQIFTKNANLVIAT